MKGCGLGAFLAQLDQDERRRFLEEYEARISAAYPRKLTAKFTFPFQRCSSSPDEASEPRW
jgi:trans-aconitate methyltransferase